MLPSWAKHSVAPVGGQYLALQMKIVCAVEDCPCVLFSSFILTMSVQALCHLVVHVYTTSSALF